MTPEELTQQREEVRAILYDAWDLYRTRDEKYKGLWSEAGAMDNAFQMRHKAMRVFKVANNVMHRNYGLAPVSKREATEDAYDLLNYTLFYIWCVEHGRWDTLEELEQDDRGHPAP